MNYFDTSAIIRSAREQKQPTGITRSHSLAEFYSFFTGGGFLVTRNGVTRRESLPPKDVLTLAKSAFKNLKFQELEATDMWNALEQAAARNVLAKNIHDYLHIVAAEKFGCKNLVTLNARHFASLTALKVVTP